MGGISLLDSGLEGNRYRWLGDLLSGAVQAILDTGENTALRIAGHAEIACLRKFYPEAENFL